MFISAACLLLTSLLSLSNHAMAGLPNGRLSHPLLSFPPRIYPTVRDVNANQIRSSDEVHYFDQLIDHSDPSRGTFKQRYWTNSEYYKTGGPIILTTPGAADASAFQFLLTNTTMPGQIAQRENGAVILIEQRFCGQSIPTTDFSVKSLQVHTVDQAIEDFDYFARHATLSFSGGDQLGPEHTPWIFVGGAQAGSYAAWVKVVKPHTFYISYASSAPVQAFADFWQFDVPILENMPANCSADVQAVISRVDSVLSGQSTDAINQLKDLFGLAALKNSDDFAHALTFDVVKWQGLQPSTGPNGDFFRFCDALEVKGGQPAPASGWGVDHALPAWGAFYKNNTLPGFCGDKDVKTCLDTHDVNATSWADPAIENSYRPWGWLLCREFGSFQVGTTDISRPTLISRFLQPDYYERTCQLTFPEAFPQPSSPDTDLINSKYRGWDINEPRLFFATGRQDMYREATMSTTIRHLVGTPKQPIEMSNAFFCSDFFMSERIDPSVAAVQDKAFTAIKTWLDGWPEYIRKLKSGSCRARRR